MKQLALILAALVTTATLAGTTATTKPGDFVLRNPDNTIPTGFDTKSSRFTTLELCVAAAQKTGVATYKCDQSTQVVVARNCDGEPAPRIYLTQVDIGGTKAWELPETRWLEPDYVEQQWLYVKNPAPVYPACWVRGWEDPTLWRANPKAEAGKVFMERIEPGMTAEDIEMPNTEEPVTMTAELQAAWDASCAERHVHKVYYPEDTCS